MKVLREELRQNHLTEGKKSLPSPVTNSPSLKLRLGHKIVSNLTFNCSKPLKNGGLSWLFFWFMFSKSSLLTVGGGKSNAAKTGKKSRMLATTVVSWSVDDETFS